MSGTDDDDETAGNSMNSKVARLIETYSLDPSVGDELEERWTAVGSERESLRTLADRFNKRLLEAAMTTAGLSTLDGEVSNAYRLLTADDVSSGDRTEVRARLSRGGIDLEQLERDFVTYQAIRSYLTSYRGVQYESRSDTDPIENTVETIQKLQSRLRSVSDTSLEQLRNTDRITVGEQRIIVDVNVLCEDCGTQYELVELLERGGCDCDQA